MSETEELKIVENVWVATDPLAGRKGLARPPQETHPRFGLWASTCSLSGLASFPGSLYFLLMQCFLESEIQNPDSE